MKRRIVEEISIPSGVECSLNGSILNCSNSNAKISKEFIIHGAELSISSNKLIFISEKGNKNQYKKIKSSLAHIKNMFQGLENKFVYKLQACNVHFPMTLKVDKNKLLINNFLGEKKPRIAEIKPDVNVEIKGQEVIVSSHNKDLAGQTVANIEKSTRVKYRDRRVFQDGIYLIEKPSIK